LSKIQTTILNIVQYYVTHTFSLEYEISQPTLNTGCIIMSLMRERAQRAARE